MRFSSLLVKLSLGIAFLVLCNSALFAQDAELVRHFDYDAKAPLDLKVLGTEKRGEATVYDVTYASPKGGVVPAYLVVPAQGKGPFAGVIWGHWYWTNSEMRNRKQFLDEAVALAPASPSRWWRHVCSKVCCGVCRQPIRSRSRSSPSALASRHCLPAVCRRAVR